MKRAPHSILREVAVRYLHALQRYQRHSGRGDVDRADDAFSEMQEIESCVTVIETSTAWRRPRDPA
jgi:hypothetical protein